MSVVRLARIALMVAATATLSFVRIPLPLSPVPITGQTLGTMLAGVLLGPGDGAISQAVYVFLGVVGLPLFGGLAGPGVLLGPTGGYLVGLIAGAWIVGWISDRGEGVLPILAGCFLGGVVAVYVPGILWLSRITRMGLGGAFLAGALPYLPGDLLKVLATYLMAVRLDFLRRSRLQD
ncbi:MAG: biotin transporter BioY [Clostridia bacterium]